MRSVLFVCTANICRSPTAEGVMRRMLAKEGVEEKFVIESAGTHDYHVGKPPFPNAVEMAKRRGYDITGCTSRKVAPGDFDHFDMILAMDRGNLANLRTIAPTRSKQKIELFLEYGDKYHGQEIPDPYAGTEKDFQLAFDMIEDGCAGLVELMKRTKQR
jgi:protein-tyrosine phosphatase